MSANETVRPESAPAANPITIFLCGDVMTGRGIDQVLPHPGKPDLYESWVTSALDYVRLAEQASGPIPRPADFAYVWGAALDELRRVGPDARIINLETSITRSEAFVPKGINYRMNPDNVGCLTAAGITCCGLANNHVLDWGAAGLVETLETLERAGIRTAGAGRDLAASRAPAVLDIRGKGRVVVFALASETSGVPRDWAAKPRRPGVNLLPDLSDSGLAEVAREVERARRPGDVIVASIHWGPNWGYGIPEQERHFAHALIDRAGVSVVHGHSSHHVKAIEVYKRRLILYGCGDFLNDYEGIAGYEEFRPDLALMYFASVDPASGELAGLAMTPLQIRRFSLQRASDEDAGWLASTLDKASRLHGVGLRLGADGRLALA